MQEASNDRVSTLMKTLGAIVKEQRIAQGKSIYKISAESSLSKETWREIELGHYKDIKLTTIWKIAEGLDIPTAILIGDLCKKLGDSFNLTDIK